MEYVRRRRQPAATRHRLHRRLAPGAHPHGPGHQSGADEPSDDLRAGLAHGTLVDAGEVQVGGRTVRRLETKDKDDPKTLMVLVDDVDPVTFAPIGAQRSITCRRSARAGHGARPSRRSPSPSRPTSAMPIDERDSPSGPARRPRSWSSRKPSGWAASAPRAAGSAAARSCAASTRARTAERDRRHRDSASSTVAAQLPSRFSASSEREPGSAA